MARELLNGTQKNSCFNPPIKIKMQNYDSKFKNYRNFCQNEDFNTKSFIFYLLSFIFRRERMGFTLIELVISIGIIIIVTGLVVAGFRVGGRNEALSLAAQDVASVIKQAQSWTLTGQVIKGEFPRGGYGVHFSAATPSSYILFADLDNDLIYDDGEAIDGGTHSLPPQITIAEVLPSATADLVFKPPAPEIFINKYREANELAVSLKHSDTGQIKKVRVDRISGRISSE